MKVFRLIRLARALGAACVRPFVPAVLAMVLTLPALWTGLQSDDYGHRLTLLGSDLLDTRQEEMFSFVDGNPERTAAVMDFGLFPWWTQPDLRLCFMRPVTVLTHRLDYRLWPDSPFMMHVHSLVWLGAMVAAAAVLYRRLMAPIWVAGFAAALFAVDDAHGMPAAWIANRNALVATCFCLLALIAQDRWCRDGWRPGLVLGPIALLLGLLAGEIAVGGVGYVFAYALFVDTVPPKRRLGSLLGFALVVVGWMVTYIAFGFGTSGSEFYIDPVGEPVRFVRAVLSHAPILLTAQWLGPPADMTVLLSTGVWRVVWVAGCVLLVLPAWMFARLLRRDATARFWATGMVIAVVPVCATLPMDRLLFVVGIGAMGLVARFVQCYVNQDATTGTRRITSSAVVLLLVVHGLIAPLALPFRAWSLSMLGSWLQPATAAVPNDPSVEDQTVVVLNAPSVAGASLYLPCMRAAMGLSVPKRVRALANGLYPIHIRRPDAHTLVVQPEGGFLRPPGERLEGDTVDHGPMYLGYTMQIMDRLFRSSTTPMRMGEKITLSGMEVEVISLTPDERPAAARFRFDRPLEDASLLWIRWKDGDYEPYRPPPVGTSVTLPAVQLPTTPFDSLFRTISSRAMRGQMWPRM